MSASSGGRPGARSHSRELRMDCPHLQLHRSRDQLQDDPSLLSQLFITQTSVAVMASPLTGPSRLGPELERSRCSLKYTECGREVGLGQLGGCRDLRAVATKSGTERVVVALLLGALIIIFLTLVLSLVYLRETQHQQHWADTTALVTHNKQDRQLTTEERLLQWGAANNVKIKPGSGTSSTRHQMRGTCQLPACWRTGRRIMLMVDTKADPCTSLYDLACGGWVKNVTSGRGSVGSLATVSVMDENKLEVDKKIRDLVLTLPDPGPEAAASGQNQWAKIKTFYRSCEDTAAIQRQGYTPAVEFLHNTFGRHLDPALPDTGDLTEVIAELLTYSSTALFDVSVDVDPSDNNKLLGVISLPARTGLATPRPSLHGTETGQPAARGSGWSSARSPANSSVVTSEAVYRELQATANAQKIGRLFSVVENYKILNNYSQPFKQSTTDEIVGFVAALTKMIPGHAAEQQDSRNNKIYNKYNIAELQSSFRYVDWRLLMRRLLGGGEVPSSQLFLVHFPSFLRQLDRMVSLFGVRVARLSLIVLFAQEVLEDVVTTTTTTSGQERWRHCSGLAQLLFPGAASHLYIKSFSDSDRKIMVGKAKELFKEMRKKAIRQVESTSWLSRQTKSKVMQKLATTKVLVEPPSFYLNRTWVTRGLEAVTISPGCHLTNVLALARRRRLQLFSSKVAGVDEERVTWSLASPLAVTAFRVRQFNSVVLPLALLASLAHPRAVAGVPRSLADGGLGFVLGHEIWHSLDHSGRGFDLQGRLATVWDQASLARYARKSECLKKSYSNNHKRRVQYRGQLVQLAVDGNTTFDENLCDVEALEMVSRHALRDTERQDELPGVNFTKDQTFFINLAQGYCGVIGSVSQVLLSHLSQHSTFRERIDGMMMNSQKFSETFQCGPGTRMNPPRKCGGHMFGK